MGPKKQDFLPKINILKGNHCILRIQGAPVRQKLGMILENKVVQKLKLEKNVFYKKWSPKLIFLNDFFFEKIQLIFDIENWLWKYNFGTFWRTIIHRRIVLKLWLFAIDCWNWLLELIVGSGEQDKRETWKQCFWNILFVWCIFFVVK